MRPLLDRRTFERMFLNRNPPSVMLRRGRMREIKSPIPGANEKPHVKRIQTTVPTTDAGALAEKAKT